MQVGSDHECCVPCLIVCVPHCSIIKSTQSSMVACYRAKALAAEIGAYHLDVCIDTLVAALVTLFTSVTGPQT